MKLFFCDLFEKYDGWTNDFIGTKMNFYCQ